MKYTLTELAVMTRSQIVIHALLEIVTNLIIVLSLGYVIPTFADTYLNHAFMLNVKRKRNSK